MAFLSAALAETEVEESRGSFVIKDRDVRFVSNHQTIEDIRVIEQTDTEILSGIIGVNQKTGVTDGQYPFLLVTGSIFSVKQKRNEQLQVNEHSKFLTEEPSASATYSLLFDQKRNNQIGFEVKFGEPIFGSHSSSKLYRRKRKLVRIRRFKLGWCWASLRRGGFSTVSSSEDEGKEEKSVESVRFNRVCFTYSSERSERFYGFGEQFSRMDFKGKRVPIIVQEQGIGRGDQPISLAINLVSYRAAGDWSTTYAPSPFYMTSKMRSLYLEGYEYSVFDLTREDRVQIQVHGDSVRGRILNGNSPCELIECFTETIGKPPLLPEWIISAAVVGMQGGTDTVRRVWDELKSYDVPISAFWLQDWVGQRETLIGSQLWWNWEVDRTRYWGWPNLLKDLNEHHIKVMTYCNPCLVPTNEKPNRMRDLYEEAKKLDILVKAKNGEAYLVPNTAFDVGMLDLTHPYTAIWFKQILQEMVDEGVRGWMADFGEGLPVDASLYSGEDPVSAHNKYPELWAKLNREFVEEWKKNRLSNKPEDPEDDLVFFMRAGFRNSPKWAMLFWEGDQMVSWQAHDGIKSAVVGLLSSGLSGYAFNHSDIGGYCAVNLPFIRYTRSEELLLRWMELNSFTTVFRTHEGNKPRCNAQFYSNHKMLSHFARFSKVYKAWKFYRIQLVKEAAEKGLPVCRHLFLHYPDDEHVHKLSYQQFLVGTEILVVPVLDKGKKHVKAYFPETESFSWQHIWTGKLFSKKGCEAFVEAPIGYPAVFVKAGSTVGETLLRNLADLNLG